MKMKKILKTIAIITALSVLTGCSGGGIPLSYDSEIPEGGIQDNNDYNHELFYRNDALWTTPDPFILQVTDKESTEYGYYYLYGTNLVGIGYETYRSKDLKTWENMSSEKGFYCFEGKEEDALGTPYWAPEVIYDEETDKYYLFYSGSPSETDKEMYMGIAIADEPYGPFETYSEHLLIEPEKANAVVPEDERGSWDGIDASPYIGADGEKYIVFCRRIDTSTERPVSEIGIHENIWGVRMEDWTTPDYSTLTRLSRVAYETTEMKEVVDYESDTVRNEGPHMYVRKHEDGTATYYLTSSINDLNKYSVVQAVGESPLGPFRKLTEEEGGILLANDHATWDHIKGPGHHCFIQAGDELMIFYHQQENRMLGDSWIRSLAQDRVEFVDNGTGLEVMYVNGPTWSLQPQVEIGSEYKNIASEAKVKATKGDNIEALTDGLLSIYKEIDYVKEFESSKTTTITLSFEEYREITGLMIYNSKWFEKAFLQVDRIEFDFKKEEVSEGATAHIDNLEFDWASYKNASADDMRPGGSAVAVFEPLQVKEIRITFKLPIERPDELQLLDDEGYIIDQETIGVSEIAILGK